MFDSPLSASAYEILGVASTVDDDDLRRTYRLRLRQTHPDTGGDAAVFIQVQRAWELIGTPEGRAAYDRSRGAETEWSGWRAPSARATTRPAARSFGTAGGSRRARYESKLQAWAGATVHDPYAPGVVRAAPRELRQLLANALAEEATADAVSGLGMGFTMWHGVSASAPGSAHDDADRIDHLVLGPSGLYGVLSADFGGVVGLRRGEIVGPSLGHRAPVTTLVSQISSVARAARVKFSGAVIVLPDDDIALPVTPLGSIRGLAVVVVRRSVLPSLLRTGIPGSRTMGGNELFDVRTRLKQSVRFVES